MVAKHEAAAHTRQRLIEAALLTVQAHGANALTLDQVARTAGLSKGGLLHHFNSKESLIEAVLRYLIQTFRQQVEAHYAAEPVGTGRWMRAYIRASWQAEALPREGIVLLLQATSEAPLRALIEADQNFWQERLTSDGLATARVYILQQAVDSIWIGRTLRLYPASTLAEDALLAELLRLAEGAIG